jgi:hypothetical protein
MKYSNITGTKKLTDSSETFEEVRLSSTPQHLLHVSAGITQ